VAGVNITLFLYTNKGGEKMTHCLSWIGLEGEHKFYRKSLEYINLLAYYKAFSDES